MSSPVEDIENLVNDYASRKQSYAMSESSESLQHKRSALLEWYHANRRNMPWRGDDKDFQPSAYGMVKFDSILVRVIVLYTFFN